MEIVSMSVMAIETIFDKLLHLDDKLSHKSTFYCNA